jgi:DNA polymerase elongation subunit (family B)
MMTHDFVVANCDTDAISFCKKDMSPLLPNEQFALIEELNSLMPEKIKFTHDGYFRCVIIVKAKNYIMQYENGTIKIKGSALKATLKPRAFQKYIRDIINLLLAGKSIDEVIILYHQYVHDILNLKDITQYSSKKTVTEKVLNSERTNETKVADALGEDIDQYQEGDKIRVYFDKEGALHLEENWDINNPDHDPFKLLEMLWKTTQTFSSILDIKRFEKYHLKGKRKLLDNLTNP